MIVTSAEYAARLEDLGFAVLTRRDDSLYCPSPDWLWEFAHRIDRMFPTYTKEAWDCDDFAMFAVTQASIENYRSGRTTGHSFSYAQVMLRELASLNGIVGPGGHATNVVHCNDDITYYFEPQSKLFTPVAKVAPDAVVPLIALV